jgi:hypothetical protein
MAKNEGRHLEMYFCIDVMYLMKTTTGFSESRLKDFKMPSTRTRFGQLARLVSDKGAEGIGNGLGTFLSQVPLGVNNPPFLFPSNYAGPDVVFVLDSKDSKLDSKRVVLVQVKSGPLGETTFKEALLTVDPEKLYRNKNGKAIASWEDEMKLADKEHPNLNFVRVLYAPKTIVKKEWLADPPDPLLIIVDSSNADTFMRQD